MGTPSQTYKPVNKNVAIRPRALNTSGDSPLVQTIIAIDPGGTTGWALFSWPDNCFEDEAVPLLGNISYWTCGQLDGDEDDQVDKLIDMAKAWPHATFVIEDFRLKQMAGGHALLAPVRITAAFQNRFRWTGPDSSKRRKLYKQMPGLALPSITDERLQRSGFWDCTKGKPHARDAIRHCLMFARRKKAGLLFEA